VPTLTGGDQQLQKLGGKEKDNSDKVKGTRTAIKKCLRAVQKFNDVGTGKREYTNTFI